MKEKPSATKTRGSNTVKVNLSFTAEGDQPPVQADVIARFEKGVRDLVIKDRVSAQAAKCSGAYCLGKVNGVKALAAELFGVSLSCKKSRCSWMYDSEQRKWIRVCSLDCTGANGLAVSGSVS